MILSAVLLPSTTARLGCTARALLSRSAEETCTSGSPLSCSTRTWESCQGLLLDILAFGLPVVALKQALKQSLHCWLFHTSMLYGSQEKEWECVLYNILLLDR